MTRQMLSVVDWTADPDAAMAALAPYAGEAEITIVVPATLHGLDWIGDPHASVPCARRQAGELRRAAAVLGVELRHVAAGDPDPHTAAMDFCLSWSFDEVAVIGFSRRVAKATGLPARRIAIGRAQGRHWPLSRRVHCVAA
jgi:hypothetical protein